MSIVRPAATGKEGNASELKGTSQQYEKDTELTGRWIFSRRSGRSKDRGSKGKQEENGAASALSPPSPHISGLLNHPPNLQPFYPYFRKEVRGGSRDVAGPDGMAWFFQPIVAECPVVSADSLPRISYSVNTCKLPLLVP